MKIRCVFSIVIAAILSILSIIVSAKRLADEIAERKVMSVTAAAVDLEEPELKQAVTEEILIKESLEKPYQSCIASMDWNAEEAYLLAKIAMAEAESEDTEGKALVMLVVLNRVWDGNKFPDTIKEVIYQPGQFSPISNGRFDNVEPDPDCWAALDLIRTDKWDGSCGALYFESKSESTWHRENLNFLFQHGKHYFYTDREGAGD